MTRYHYAWHALLPDYFRGVGGFGLSASGAFLLHPLPALFWMLFALALLFLAFALHTGLRHLSAIDVSGEAVRQTGPFGKAILWQELRGLDLRYYSTRKDKTEGWMRLTVRGLGQRRIAADGTIGDFSGLAARVAAEAEARGVPMSETSRANLGALGIRLEPARPQPEEHSPKPEKRALG